MFELNQQQPCTEIFQGHRNYSLIQLPFDPYQSSLRLYVDRARPRHRETSQSGAIQLKETNTEKKTQIKKSLDHFKSESKTERIHETYKTHQPVRIWIPRHPASQQGNKKHDKSCSNQSDGYVV